MRRRKELTKDLTTKFFERQQHEHLLKFQSNFMIGILHQGTHDGIKNFMIRIIFGFFIYLDLIEKPVE